MNTDQVDAVVMLMESAAKAAEVALEVSTRLGIGVIDETLGTLQCYRDWLSWCDGTGPALVIAEDVEHAA